MRKFDYKKIFHKKAYDFFVRNNCNSILDVGCGIGEFIGLNPDIIQGYDGNKNSVNICLDKNYNVKLGRLPKLEYGDKYFDGVYLSHIVEHFMPNDLYELLKECDRVLKPGGMLIIFTPLINPRFYDNLTHIKPYNPMVFRKYLTGKYDKQRSGDLISHNYIELDIVYRYRTIKFITYFVYRIFGLKIFNYFSKNGYMIVFKKK